MKNYKVSYLLFLFVYVSKIVFAIPSFPTNASGCENTYSACLGTCSSDYPGDFGLRLGCADGCGTARNNCYLGMRPWVGKISSAIMPPPINAVHLNVVRQDSAGGYLNGQGTVSSVAFYAVRLDSFLAYGDNANWDSLGVGAFNTSNNSWEITWNTQNQATSQDYVVCSVFFDANLLDGVLHSMKVIYLPPAAIPTLTEWALIALATLLVGAGIYTLNRRMGLM